MTPVLFAWMTSAAYGLETIVAKVTHTYTIKNPWLLNFTWSLVVLALTTFVAGPSAILTPPSAWWWVLATGVLYSVTGMVYILCLKLLDVSVFGPLFTFRTAFSLLLGVGILAEALSPVQMAAIIVMFVAGFFVNYEEKVPLKSFFRPAIALAMALMVLLSFYGLAMNQALLINDFWQVTFWTTLIGQGVLVLTIPFFYEDLKKTRLRLYRGVLAMGVLDTGGMIAENRAFADNVSITTAIIAIPFAFIFTLLLAKFRSSILEHHTRKTYAVRIAATLVMFTAGLLLT